MGAWDAVTTSTLPDTRTHELREIRGRLKRLTEQIDDHAKQSWQLRESVSLLRERLARLEAQA